MTIDRDGNQRAWATTLMYQYARTAVDDPSLRNVHDQAYADEIKALIRSAEIAIDWPATPAPAPLTSPSDPRPLTSYSGTQAEADSNVAAQGRATWRVVMTDTETCSGIAPRCNSSQHPEADHEDAGVYACCPEPHIETWSEPLAARIVEALNGEQALREEIGHWASLDLTLSNGAVGAAWFLGERDAANAALTAVTDLLDQARAERDDANAEVEKLRNQLGRAVDALVADGWEAVADAMDNGTYDWRRPEVPS